MGGPARGPGRAGAAGAAAGLAALWRVPAGPVAVAAGGVAVLLVVALAERRIGGYTGDVLGAVEQMFEMGLLLGVAAVLSS